MDILISEELQSPAIDGLEAKYKISRDPALWKDAARLKTSLAEARAIMIRNQTKLTADLLRAAPNLVAIGRVGVGLDNIDVATASALGVVVVAPLNANAVSVAELSVGLMLALARRLPKADRSTKGGGWDRKGCTGIELAGKTLAICGLGRIGRMVAERARVFGLTVIAYDPMLPRESPAALASGVTLYDELNQALAIADFVSVHLPLTPETRHLFNASRLAAMKPGSFLINTSRGGVIDETAFAAALQGGHLGGAGLDVREVEPPVVRGALETMENVILTPHIGAFTQEAQARSFEAVAGDLDRLLSGKPAVNFVNFEAPKR